MKRYKAVMKTGFKVGLAYRFDFFVTLATAPVSLIVFYFLWKSIFAYSGEEVIQGFTFNAMISYYLINMVVAFFTWSKIERWMENDIRYGHMIMDLLRPVEYLFSVFSFELGLNLLAIIIEAVPFLIIGILFFHVTIPSLVNLLFFVVSLLLANALYFLISYLIGLSAFWFKRIEGISKAKKPVIHFFSGGLIPLTFFPLVIQKVSYYLPFQYIRFIPISFYLGRYGLAEMFGLLAIQMIWVIILFTIAKLLWVKAFKKFAGAGA